MCEDMIEEFSTGRVVEDDTDVLFGFDCLVESNNVWMVQRLSTGKRRVSK